MRLRLSSTVALGVLALAVPALASGGARTATAPDPVTCEGYPEKRLYLENQSWWEPQAGPATHPGAGKQGHIHVGGCFPLHQRVAGTLTLDLLLQLHNMPGLAGLIRVDVGEYKHEFRISWTCPGVDCSRTEHLELPLDLLPVSGWQQVNVFLLVRNADGAAQRNVTRWFVFVDNGKPAVERYRRVFEGGSWLTNRGAGSNYARARLEPGSLPWDEATGAAVPVRGLWTPLATFENAVEALALVDPALHADPPRLGVRAYDGAAGRRIPIPVDTRQLPDGRHRLLLVACDRRADGRHCGVLVVPFVSENGNRPAATASATVAPAQMGHATANARPGPLTVGMPRVAYAGRRLAVSIEVKRGTAPVTAAASCTASIEGRSLAAERPRLEAGRVTCAWQEDGSGHRRVSGSIRVRHGRESAVRPFVVHLY